MDEWINEWMNGWMTTLMNGQIKSHQWEWEVNNISPHMSSLSVNEWMYWWTNRLMNGQIKWMNDCIDEWTN